MRKGLLILITILLLLIPLGSFANSTNNVIIKEYDHMGNYQYKCIPEIEYNNLNMSVLSRGSRRIEYIQDDLIRSVSFEKGSNTSLSWGKDRIGSQNLINRIGNTSNQVIVAVLDTGVDHKHNFLKDRLIEGYNFIDDNKNTMDVHSHGTHVAGILADSTNRNIKIMPVKVLGDDGIGSDFAVGSGIYYAVDMGADIINMSLGGLGHSPYVAEAIEFAISKDILVVVGAGNESRDTKDYYPASEELALVVSATDEFDNFADFSNYGKSVDIAAPGVSIYSSVPGDDFRFSSGTSMATSYITSLAALIKQEDLSRDIYMIEELLKIHIDDLGLVGKDIYFGEGLANVSKYPMDKKDNDNNKAYTLMDEKYGVPLKKEWTVAFSRNFKENEVNDIKVMKGDQIIPCHISHDGKSKIMIKSKMPYESKTTYHILVHLKNNNSYKMKFTTMEWLKQKAPKGFFV